MTPVPLFQYVDHIKDAQICLLTYVVLIELTGPFTITKFLCGSLSELTPKDMKIFLTVERIRALSDSVLFVAVVLLVYNLASLATSEPDIFNPEIFFKTLVAYINSFIVVFLFWATFTNSLNYIKHLTEILFSLIIIFMIFVTLIPVANVGLLQQEESPRSIIFASTIHISAGSSLILLLFYSARTNTIPTADFRLLLVSASLVPAVYFISLLVSYANIFISQLIVLSIMPLFIVMRKMVCKISNTE
jgi:uncharacterized membrane protein